MQFVTSNRALLDAAGLEKRGKTEFERTENGTY